MWAGDTVLREHSPVHRKLFRTYHRPNDYEQRQLQQDVTADNVVRHLLTAGKTWKAYEERLPTVGYISPDTGKYARRHCPLSYVSDVINSSTQKMNLVPFTRFKADLANNALPAYSFITPNLCSDAHDCSLTTGDNWLKANIDPLIQSSTFKSGGLVVIVFDESQNDNSHGGGRIAWGCNQSEVLEAGVQVSTSLPTPEHSASHAGRLGDQDLSGECQERVQHVGVF
jgi:phospholipase C